MESSVTTNFPNYIRLPVEIYRLIISFIPKVYPLLGTSRFLSDEAERILYQNIDLSGDRIGYMYRQYTERRIQLFEHLARCERVATLVRGFIITPLSTGFGRTPEVEPSEQFFAALNKALRATTNLKRLTISRFYARLSFEIEPLEHQPAIFSGCTFQLEYLLLQGLYVEDCPPEVVKELKVLDVRHGFVGGDQFPSLTTILVSDRWEQMQNVVFSAGSNVRALYWLRALPLGNPKPSSSMTALRMTSPTCPDLDQLLQLFPLLQYLCIEFWYNDVGLIRFIQIA